MNQRDVANMRAFDKDAMCSAATGYRKRRTRMHMKLESQAGSFSDWQTQCGALKPIRRGKYDEWGWRRGERETNGQKSSAEHVDDMESTANAC